MKLALATALVFVGFSMTSISAMAAGTMAGYSGSYHDVTVVDCGDETFVITIDPNRCGENMAKGAGGCLEIAIASERLAVAQTDASGTLTLSGRNNVRIIKSANSTGITLVSDALQRTYNNNSMQLSSLALSADAAAWVCQEPISR